MWHYDVDCEGSPDNIIICKKVNKLVYKKLTRVGTIVD